MRFLGLFFCFVILTGFQSEGFGTGFYLPDQNAKAQGQGGAFAAQADNPSAVFYNPAGIAQLEGTQITLGSEFINFQADFENNAGSKQDMNDKWAAVPGIFITSDLCTEKLGVGLGIYSPFGLSTDWDDTGLLRYDAAFSKIEMLNVNPAIAYQILPQLSLGGGVDYYYLRAYELNAMRDYGAVIGLSGAFDGGLSYDADGSDWGFNAGILFTPHPKHSFALTYRSSVTIDTDGKFDATTIPSFMGLGSALSFNASSDLNFPSVVTGGYAFRPIEKLKLEVDVTWLEWSVTDKLEIENEDSGGLLIDKTLDWDDSWTFAVGAEYMVNERWYLRAGYGFAESPIPEETFSPSIPVIDRHVISAGTGYKWERFTIDLAYSIGLTSDRRDIDTNNLSSTVLGSFDILVHEIGVSANYRF